MTCLDKNSGNDYWHTISDLHLAILLCLVSAGDGPSIHSLEDTCSSHNFPSESTASESSNSWKVINVSKALTQRVAASVVTIDPFAVIIKQDSFDFRIASLLLMYVEDIMSVCLLVVHVGRKVDRVVGHQWLPCGHRCTVGVLAKTLRCALMPRVASKQSANPLWLLECGPVKVLWWSSTHKVNVFHCIAFARVSCLTTTLDSLSLECENNTYTSASFFMTDSCSRDGSCRRILIFLVRPADLVNMPVQLPCCNLRFSLTMLSPL